jgi:hypothetical protein
MFTTISFMERFCHSIADLRTLKRFSRFTHWMLTKTASSDSGSLCPTTLFS